MNKSIILMVFTLFFSSLASAETTLALQAELVPQVLNGDKIHNRHFTARHTIQLQAGQNQLAVTIGQIVFEDGKRRKFDSQPLLLTFNAPDQQALTMSYDTFRTIDDANQFERSPEFTLVTESGEPIRYELVQMNKGGLQGFRDYQREVADYNASLTKAETSHPQVLPTSEGMEGLQTRFNQLDRDQQQRFMQWAMQNLK
ncbi:hypothetical protein BCU68_15280 [Vibrio sp. 10N.286.49.B3]|nr:hypothetical protein BCU68_15280 [Vibrio sp. 10N.286.49.B3]